MSHYVIERHILESQINVAGQRGRHKSDNSNVLQLSDATSVFEKLKGSPKYWQQTRSDLVAKVEQLGPFHIFFTLSCADKRWSEIFTTILKINKGDPIKINYHPKPFKIERENNKDDDDYSYPKDKEFCDFAFSEDNISVSYISPEGIEETVKLIQYIEENLHSSKEKLLKEEIMIVTRIFNDRVKSFVKHVIMTKDDDKIPVEYYTFRVEFQQRQEFLNF